MGSAGVGQTTVPSRVRRPGGRQAPGAAIRWLTPEDRLTELGSERVLFGRADDCHCILLGRETSRHHAEVVRDGPLLVLRDLASRNGAFVNGRRVTEAPLSTGDVVRLGEWIGLITELTDTARDGVRELAPGLLGGARLWEAVEPARRAADSELAVVVQGETGTGKECIARALHAWSDRPGEFVAVNCAALPDTLAEAELFGHRKGAFTGASGDSAGYFRAAHRGTLLLDEIVDLSPAIQAKLLRVIECGEVIPLGDTRPVRVDVRIVAAAQRPLRQAVADKRFRPDLLARLEGLCVELPPLRQRREDVPGLFSHYLSRHAGGIPPRVEPAAIEQLCLHAWPYNVRELVQLVRRLLALHSSEPVLTETHVRLAFGPPGEPTIDDPPPVRPRLEASTASRRERRNAALLERLAKALEQSAGNVARASRLLGISRQRAYRLLEQRPGLDLEALRIPEPPDGGDP